MRRLRRILLNVATVGAALLLIATLLLWPCTTRTYHALRYIYDRSTGYEIATAPHALDFAVRDKFQWTTLPPKDIPAGWSTESFTWGPAESVWIPPTPPPYGDSVEYVQAPIALDHFYDPPAHHFLGFGWEVPTPGNSVVHTWRIVLPLWFVAAIVAVLPLARCKSAVMRMRRRRAAVCPTCNYDLRATPDRCPECGTDANG